MLGRMNHVGLTVLSIDDTINFYKKLTTVEIIEAAVRISGEGVSKVIDVADPDYKSCLANIGSRSFELVEHSSSKGKHFIANHNDAGGIHLAFMVEDIEAVYLQVKSLGIEPRTKPYTAHDLGGYKAFFFRDINGFQIEIGQLN